MNGASIYIELDKINEYHSNGVGLRIAKGTEVYYGSINYDDISEVEKLADELIKNISSDVLCSNIKLNDLEVIDVKWEKPFNSCSDDKIKNYM